MINRKFMLIAIFLVSLLAISAVSASGDADNQTITSQTDDKILSGDDGAISESQDDSLSMDEPGDWSDRYIVRYDGDGYTEVDMDVIARPLTKDDRNITVKLKYYDNNAPIANADLAVLTNYDYKISKVTTDSNGIGVYNVPFNTNNFSFVVGFWHDETRLADYANYNGQILYDYLIYKSYNSFWGDVYQKWYDGDWENVTYATLALTEFTKASNGKVTFKLTEDETRTPIANVDLAILTKDYKITKLTTNSNGVATYNIRSYDSNFDFVVGFWSDAKHISDYTSYNGRILTTYYCYSDDEIVPESYYIVSVINRSTGQVLPGASVSISNNENQYKGVTDSEGSLFLSYIKDGTYIVQADYQNNNVFKSDDVDIYEGRDSNYTEDNLIVWSVKFAKNAYINLYYGSGNPVEVNTNDDTPVTYEGNFKELKDLIGAAKNGTTINLDKDYIGSGQITINCNDLTINGNNHKIDATSSSRIFLIYGNKVTLKNIQFVNANVGGEGDGGAIHSYCDNLIVDDCKFINNHAYEGGAIYLDQPGYGVGKKAQLNRVTFLNNSAEVGGAIFSKQKLNVTDCEFDSNKATNWAGAIYTYNGMMAIFSTSYSVQGLDVGTVSDYYSMPLNISGKTTFKNNHADSNGGAIAIGANSNIFYGNHGQLTLNNGVVFENNTARNGGALYLKAVESNIDGAVFKNNLATAGGGAISSLNLSTLNVRNSIFTNNNAKSYGGTIYGTYFLTISNSKFANDENMEFVFYENYLDDNDDSVTPYGDFYIENNTMSGNNDFDMFYEGYYPLDFKIKLILGNVSTTSGKPVNLARLEDSNGNSIIIYNDAISTTIKDSAGKTLRNVDLVYNATTRGYGFDTSSLKNGQYSISGTAPELARDCEVINGVLKISSYALSAKDITKYYKGSEKYTVTLTDNGKPVSGVNVVINVNGKSNTVKTDSNGQASIDLAMDVGNYTVISAYEGISTTTDVNVKSTVTAGDSTGVYSNSKVSATFLNTNGKALANTKVTFKVNGKDYTATTNSNGVATANVDLGVGTYDVTAVNPVNNEQKQSKLVITKANSIIELSYSRNNGVVTLTATLTPATATGNVVFNINGENKYAPIKDGKATFTLKDLKAGSYDVTARYGGDKNLNASSSNTVTFNVAEVYPILTVNDLTKTYGTSTNLVVYLKDNKGNAIANANVNVDIGGKITPITTDSNGQASVPISLKPGKYNATVTYGDTQATAKIVVKKATPKMTAKAKTFKKTDKTKKYTITLKDNNNKAMKSTKVTIKVNKKTYTAKTSKKGVATFKLTKLTKKGKYTATVKYTGSSYHNSKTAKVKITVK